MLFADKNALVTLWLADKIISAIGDEKEFAEKAFDVTQKEINQ